MSSSLDSLRLLWQISPDTLQQALREREDTLEHESRRLLWSWRRMGHRCISGGVFILYFSLFFFLFLFFFFLFGTASISLHSAFCAHLGCVRALLAPFAGCYSRQRLGVPALSLRCAYIFLLCADIHRYTQPVRKHLHTRHTSGNTQTLVYGASKRGLLPFVGFSKVQVLGTDGLGTDELGIGGLGIGTKRISALGI